MQGRERLFVILFLFIILNLFSFVDATTYYADFSLGNDSDSGNYTNPWKTIGPHLASGPNLMVSGDVLILKNGTYYESPILLNGLYTTINGVTIQGEFIGGANVFFNSSFLHGFYPDDASINLINLNISSNSSNTNCLRIRDASHNMLIENVTFFNCTNAIDTYFNTGQASNITFKNNNFIQNGNTINWAFGKSFINSSFYNNSVNDTQIFVGQNSSIQNFNSTSLDLKDNNFIGRIKINNAEWENLFNENTFVPTSIIIENVIFPNYLNLSDFYFLDYNKAISSTYYSIYISNSSNINFENISFCSLDSFCSYDNPSNNVYNFFSQNSSNVSILNSFFYVSGYNINLIHFLFGDKIFIKNNVLYQNGTTYGEGIYVDGNNSIIQNNTVHYYNGSISYGIGFGSEGRTYWNENSSILDNFVYSHDSSELITHSVFLGYMKNSIVHNNFVVGGRYNYVIKGSRNCNISNNFGNQTSLVGIYEKAGENNVFAYNTINSLSDSDFLIYIAQNPSDGMNVTNSTWKHNKIVCLENSSNCVSVLNGSRDIYFYNTSVENQSFYFSDSTAFIERYWPLSVSGDSDITFSLRDEISNSYGPYLINNYVSTYFLQDNISLLSWANYTPYTLVASKTGCTSKSYTIELINEENVAISLVCNLVSSSGGGWVIYSPSKEELESGYVKRLGKYYRINFEFNEAKKTIIVKSVDEDKVVFEISGENYSISLNEAKKIDLDNNGYYDLQIHVDSILRSIANVEFKLIYEEIPTESTGGVVGDSQEEIEVSARVSFWTRIRDFFDRVFDLLFFWN